jgi:GT2 family glycosyltransferase
MEIGLLVVRDHPSVHCIVPTLSVRDVAPCLEALQRQDVRAAIIVVDNGADGAAAAEIRERFRCVVLSDGENLGFAGGVNLGIRHALQHGAEFVFLVNDDALVAPDALRHLLDEMRREPALGVAGASLREGPVAGSAFERVLRLRGQQCGGQDAEVEFVLGCGMLVRRSAFEAVGLFDPAFFAYFEDKEFCFRCRSAGIVIRYCSRAIIDHVGSQSTGGIAADSRLRAYLIGRGRILYWRRIWAARRPRLALLVACRSLTVLLSALIRPRASAALAELIGIVEGIRAPAGAWPRFPQLVVDRDVPVPRRRYAMRAAAGESRCAAEAAVLDDASVQLEDGVGRLRQTRVMSDEQHRRRPGHDLQHRPYDLDAWLVDRARRLVQHQ